MSSQNPLEGVSFPAADVPTVYANHVSPTMSFNDIRIYFSEVAPQIVDAVQTKAAKPNQPTIIPRLCVVVSPEFAKALAQSLQIAVAKYEGVFGTLRPPLSQQQFEDKLKSGESGG